MGYPTAIQAEQPKFFWVENEQHTQGDIPHPWDPFAALSMVDVCKKLDSQLKPALPITREIMLVIFFHETAFSNIMQATKTGKGPAVGFGQMEIFNPDKVPFFKWFKPGIDSVTFNPNMSIVEIKKKTEEYGLTSLEKLTNDRVTSDNDFAIKMHCSYFEWLFDEGYSQSTPKQKGIKSLGGLLAAQAGGGNEHFVDEFRDGGRNLAAVMGSGDRMKIINALNEVRWYFAGPKGPPAGARTKQSKSGRTLVHNPISIKRYPKYWEFTLPESDVPKLARK